MNSDEQILSSLTDRATETLRRLGYTATIHAEGSTATVVARALDRPAGIVEIAYLQRETSEVHLPIDRSFGIPEYLKNGFPEAVDAMCEIIAKIDHGDYESFTRRRLFRTKDVVLVEVQGVGLSGSRSKITFEARLAAIDGTGTNG